MSKIRVIKDFTVEDKRGEGQNVELPFFTLRLYMVDNPVSVGSLVDPERGTTEEKLET